MKPGPKKLPYTARRCERVILNLYPATAESLAALAFDLGHTPRQVAEHALIIGLQHMIQTPTRTRRLQLLIKSPSNYELGRTT